VDAVESSEVVVGAEVFSVSEIVVDSKVDSSEVVWVTLPAEVVAEEPEDVKTVESAEMADSVERVKAVVKDVKMVESVEMMASVERDRTVVEEVETIEAVEVEDSSERDETVVSDACVLLRA
jgi:DNA polymerase/3'-5' exonuclease PolX